MAANYDRDTEIAIVVDNLPLAYAFEPRIQPNRVFEAQNEPDSNEDVIPDGENRTQNTDWCHCGHCRALPTNVECICCTEMNNLAHK